MKRILFLMTLTLMCVFASVSYADTDVTNSPIVTVDTDVGDFDITHELKICKEVPVHNRYVLVKAVDFESYINKTEICIPDFYKQYDSEMQHFRWRDMTSLINEPSYMKPIKTGNGSGGLPYLHNLYSCSV